MDSRKVTSFAPALDGQVVHLSVFDRPKNEQGGQFKIDFNYLLWFMLLVFFKLS
jgi:hypothetical protein